MKLEEGKEVTPFIEPDLNEELSKCQNYFQIMKVKEIRNDYLLSGTNYNLRTFNLPSSLRTTPFITIKSGKYDNLYVDTSNNLVPSMAYKIYSRDKNNFVFGYRSAGGVITTTTKRYKDLGYGLKDYYNYTTFTASDFETSVDSSLQTILGTSAKNSYFPTCGPDKSGQVSEYASGRRAWRIRLQEEKSLFSPANRPYRSQEEYRL